MQLAVQASQCTQLMTSRPVIVVELKRADRGGGRQRTAGEFADPVPVRAPFVQKAVQHVAAEGVEGRRIE